MSQPLKSVKLPEVVEINPRRFDVPITDNELVSFVPMKAVEEETGRMHALETQAWCQVKKGYTPFQNGDVVFAKITPCMENGKYALARDLHKGRAAGSTEFHVFRPSPKLDGQYLLHFLFSSDVRKAARMNMRGAAGQLRVPVQFFESLQIPLPPLPEQRRIIAEIEKQFSRLDEGVAALKRAKANLKRYRASVFKAACEGRLVPTEAELARASGKTFETGEQLLTSILAERRQKWQGRGKYKEPVATDTSKLHKLPEGWTWTNTTSICDQVVDCHNKTAPYTDQGIPLVRTTNIRSGKIDLAATKFVSEPTYAFWSRRCFPKPGDILFTREAPMGEAGIIPDDVTLCMGQRIMLLRASSRILSRFLLTALVSPVVSNHITRTAVGSGVKHLRVRDVELLPVSLPPLAEQKRIVAEVERRLSVVDELETMVASNLKRAERLRQAILHKAFTGEF